MLYQPATASISEVQLSPAPINADWIRAGQPVARNAILSKSADGTASTFIWDCTSGTFDWIYGVDETIYFLEGSVIIDHGNGDSREFKAGDFIFFPAGSRARWTVGNYVRKIAFCRRLLPAPLGTLINLARTTKRRLYGQGEEATVANLG
jgi:uncharacterized protein